jgi:hypothetical protein
VNRNEASSEYTDDAEDEEEVVVLVVSRRRMEDINIALGCQKWL